MPIRRDKTALCCFDDDAITRATRWIEESPAELASSIGSLELVLSAGTGHTAALSALIEVLALCSNIDTLGIYGDVDFESFAPQLLLRNPGGFPNMQKVRYPHNASCPPHELLQMLQMMPNLRVCARLPKTPGDERLDAADLASFDGTIRTRELQVTPQNAELVIPLLVSGRWIVHTAVFYVRPRFLYALMNYDGPRRDAVALVDLTMHCTGDESAAPIAAWIAHSFRALQRLHVGAGGDDMLRILETLLAHGAFRLHELRVTYSIYDATAGEQQAARLAALLLSAPPSLATLGVLRIAFSAHTQRSFAHCLRDVPSFCRARRIVYSLRDNTPLAAAHAQRGMTRALSSPSPDQTRCSCCWIS